MQTEFSRSGLFPPSGLFPRSGMHTPARLVLDGWSDEPSCNQRFPDCPHQEEY